MRPHSLGYRILVALSATLLPSLLLVACHSIGDGCPTLAARDEKLGNCTVHLKENETTRVACVDIPPLADGSCPESSSQAVVDAFKSSDQQGPVVRFVCGTFPSNSVTTIASVSVSSTSTGFATGAGGATAGGGGAGGFGGAGSTGATSSTGGSAPRVNCCYGIVETNPCL